MGIAGEKDGIIYMAADAKETNPAFGRKLSVFTSKILTHGLVLGDVKHMPGANCGSWPALDFWS